MLTVIVLTTVAMLALNLVLAASIVGLRLRVRNSELRRSILQKRWRPRILQLLAGETTAEVLLPVVRRGDRRHLVELLTEYAKRISGIELDRLRSFGAPLLSRLREDLRSRRPEDRARAVQAVGLLGDSEQIPILVSALCDPSPLVAMVGATALCETHDAEAASHVITHLDRFELWSTGFLASMLAGGGPVMSGTLRGCLADDTATPLARAAAGDALRLLRNPAAAAVAANVLAVPCDREVAAASLRILESLGTAEHVDIVRPLTESSDFVLRAHAISALGSLATGDEDIAILDEAIDDPSPWVALHAARALARAGRDDVLHRATASLRPGAAAAEEVLMEGAVA
jgi:HEAT repeat protein